jgi:hypothetical protein
VCHIDYHDLHKAGCLESTHEKSDVVINGCKFMGGDRSVGAHRTRTKDGRGVDWSRRRNDKRQILPSALDMRHAALGCFRECSGDGDASVRMGARTRVDNGTPREVQVHERAIECGHALDRRKITKVDDQPSAF